MQGFAEDKSSIMYRSTNGLSEVVDFKTAMFGQPPDKGLYMPTRIPVLSQEVISSMSRMSYPEVAAAVLGRFLENEIPENELMRMTCDAYNFVVPLQEVYDEKYLMWQDEGPTLSFKDLGARMMAQLMQYYVRQSEGSRVTILTATSGDTGSAVANAFCGLRGIDCVVLFPKNEITESQRKLITTLGIKAYAVEGTFDSCQAMVKRMLVDPDMRYLNPTTANSIGIPRWLPQTVQYFYAYSRTVREQEDAPVGSVPCGNLGHLTAGKVAMQMGLPIQDRKSVV